VDGWTLRQVDDDTYRYFFTGHNTDVQTNAAAGTGFHIARVVRDGDNPVGNATVDLSADSAMNTDTGTNGFTPEGSGTAVGMNRGGAAGFNGDIAELIIYDRVLSDVEISHVNAYLNQKYALDTLALTYVKATHGPGGNTVNTSTGSATDWGTPGSRTNGDDLWGDPVTQPYSVGGVNSWESASENSPGLTTTVSGLQNGEYDVYAVWAAHPSSDTTWDILAGLSGQPLALFDGNNSTVVSNDGSIGRAAVSFLGQVRGTSLSIDIDDTVGIGSTDRTRYIGLAYELVRVIPEPSTLALAALGLLSLAFFGRRRRRRG
jgi:hypothetical protein